jgi:hypothetical protein
VPLGIENGSNIRVETFGQVRKSNFFAPLVMAPGFKGLSILGDSERRRQTRSNVQIRKSDSEAESERGARLIFFLGTHAEVVAESIEDLAMYTVIFTSVFESWIKECLLERIAKKLSECKC